MDRTKQHVLFTFVFSEPMFIIIFSRSFGVTLCFFSMSPLVTIVLRNFSLLKPADKCGASYPYGYEAILKGHTYLVLLHFSHLISLENKDIV